MPLFGWEAQAGFGAARHIPTQHLNPKSPTLHSAKADVCTNPCLTLVCVYAYIYIYIYVSECLCLCLHRYVHTCFLDHESSAASLWLGCLGGRLRCRRLRHLSAAFVAGLRGLGLAHASQVLGLLKCSVRRQHYESACALRPEDLRCTLCKKLPRGYHELQLLSVNQAALLAQKSVNIVRAWLRFLGQGAFALATPNIRVPFWILL